jgi:hypothetical protein
MKPSCKDCGEAAQKKSGQAVKPVLIRSHRVDARGCRCRGCRTWVLGLSPHLLLETCGALRRVSGLRRLVFRIGQLTADADGSQVARRRRIVVDVLQVLGRIVGGLGLRLLLWCGDASVIELRHDDLQSDENVVPARGRGRRKDDLLAEPYAFALRCNIGFSPISV